MAARASSAATAAAAAASSSRRALVARVPAASSSASSSGSSAVLLHLGPARESPPSPLLLTARGLATAAGGRSHGWRARRPSPAPASSEATDGLARRLIDEELARKEEASEAWRAGIISDALALLRRKGQGSDAQAHRQALLTLGGYAPHLAPEDAVLLVRQALEAGNLGKVAYAALEELRRMPGGPAALRREADAVVAAALKGGRVQMAVMVVEDVQRERVPFPAGRGKPSFISRDSYLGLLRRLNQKGRSRQHWQLAESLITHKGRPAAAVLAGDAEAAALAMVVCWRMGKWQSVRRLLDCLVEDGGLVLDEQAQQRPRPPPRTPQGGRTVTLDDRATLQRMEALFAALRARDEGKDKEGSKAPKIVTAEFCNMLLHARLRAGDRAGAVALAEEMLAAAAAVGGDGATTTPGAPLPDANALSVCLVLEALGKAGEWAACLRLLQRAKGALPALDKAGLAMVYKTAIAAAGKAGLWEGCLSLFYELHERGLPTDPGAYTALFKALRTAGRLDALRAFLEAMPAQNVTPDRAAYNVLFAALGKEGLMDEALTCFQRMVEEQGLEPRPYDYGTLIAACGHAAERAVEQGEAGAEEEVDRLVGTARRLLGEAARVGRGAWGGDGGMSNCYVQMLKVYGKAGRWEEARALLAEMRRAGSEPTFSHYFEAMRAAAFAGAKDAALDLMEEYEAATGEEPHPLLWNAALLACKEAGDTDGCLALLSQMRAHGVKPRAGSYGRALAALGRAGRLEEAFGLIAEVRAVGDPQPLDRAAFGALIRACGEGVPKGAKEEGEDAADDVGARARAVHRVLGEMRAAGCRPDALTVAQAVAALARGCGRVQEAEALLLAAAVGGGEEDKEGKEGEDAATSGGVGRSGPPSLLAYHALMLASVEQEDGPAAGRRCEALLSAMMNRHGLCPTPVTHALLLRAGAGPQALALAQGFLQPAAAAVAVAGGGGEGEEDEEEEAGVLSFEAARRSVEKALSLNAHDDRLRALHQTLAQV